VSGAVVRNAMDACSGGFAARMPAGGTSKTRHSVPGTPEIARLLRRFGIRFAFFSHPLRYQVFGFRTPRLDAHVRQRSRAGSHDGPGSVEVCSNSSAGQGNDSIGVGYFAAARLRGLRGVIGVGSSREWWDNWAGRALF